MAATGWPSFSPREFDPKFRFLAASVEHFPRRHCLGGGRGAPKKFSSKHGAVRRQLTSLETGPNNYDRKLVQTILIEARRNAPPTNLIGNSSHNL